MFNKIIFLLLSITFIYFSANVNATEKYIISVTAINSQESRKARAVFSITEPNNKRIKLDAPYHRDAPNNYTWVIRGYNTVVCRDNCFEGGTTIKAVTMFYQFKKKFSKKWEKWQSKQIFLRSCFERSQEKIDYRIKENKRTLFDVTISCEAYQAIGPSMSP